MMMTDEAMPRFGSPVGGWHCWFAWKPVRTYDRRMKWLCRLERRCIEKHHYLDGGPDFWRQYRVVE